MPLYTTTSAQRAELSAALRGGRLGVLLLCAAWCDLCRNFRGTAESLAAAFPDVAFVWIDIEDDATIAGDIDVENFPTLAIVRGETVLHYGVSLPHERGIARLVETMGAATRAASDVPDEVQELGRQLRTPPAGY